MVGLQETPHYNEGCAVVISMCDSRMLPSDASPPSGVFGALSGVFTSA